jgi:hypothetical protein
MTDSKVTSHTTISDILVQMAMMEKALELLSSANLALNDPYGSSQFLKPLEALALLELSQRVCNTRSKLFWEFSSENSNGIDSRLTT